MQLPSNNNGEKEKKKKKRNSFGAQTILCMHAVNVDRLAYSIDET